MGSFFYKRLSFYCFNLSPYPCLTSYLYQYNVFFYLNRGGLQIVLQSICYYFLI